MAAPRAFYELITLPVLIIVCHSILNTFTWWGRGKLKKKKKKKKNRAKVQHNKEPQQFSYNWEQ